MKSSRYTADQVAFAMRQAESGTPVSDICRKMGIAKRTFYRWKRRFAGMGIVDVRRLRVLEEENRKLKQLVADLSLAKQMLQDVLRKNPEACSTAYLW
ncbi:transposase [Chloroflexota bacterium]